MFKGRKKSNAKRPDEGRERDNSRVLDRYTDTDKVASPNPFRRQSLPAGNFQYLKLTDGFNIVLGTGSADSMQASSLQLSPDQSPKSRLKAGENDDGTTGNRKKHKPMIRSLTDKDSHTYHVDLDLEHQSKNIHIDRAGITRITSSVTNVSSLNATSQQVKSEPKDMSPDLPVISETAAMPADLENKSAVLSKNPPLKMGHTDLSHVSENPCAKVHVGHARGAPALDFHPESKQNAKHTVHSGDSPSSAQRLGGDGEGGTRGMGKPEDKSESLCVESGRGASNKKSQFPVFSPLEGAATQADDTHSLSCSKDEATVRESERVPSASVEDYGDGELNKPSGQNSAHSPTASNHRSASDSHNAGPTSDEVKLNAAQPRLGQVDNETDQSSSKRNSDSRRTVAGATEVDQRLSTDVGIGHESIPKTSASDNSKAPALRDGLIGLGKKKTSAEIPGEVSESGKKQSLSDMFRLNRHTLHVKSDPSEKPAVYRKLEETETGRPETTDSKTSASDAARKTERPETAEPPSQHHVQPAPSTEHIPHTPSPKSPRSGAPVPLPKPRKEVVESVYENWTINQAVTQAVSPNLHDDDDEDADDTDSCNISPGSTLDRRSAEGSKDSGLRVDVQSAGAVGEAVTGCGGGDGGGGGGGGVAATTLTDKRRTGKDRIQHGEAGGPEYCEGDTVDGPSVSLVVEEVSAVYENTDLRPRPQDDRDSSTGTPEVPESPDPNRLTPNMASRRHHDNHSLTSTTTSEEDHRHDFSLSGDSSFEEGEDEEKPLTAAALQNMQKMRQLLVKGVLETEKTYLAILELLLHYKRTLEASCRTSQPVISEEDIVCVFSNLQELLDIHKVFVDGLQGKVDLWSSDQTVGDVFMCLVEKFPKFGGYAENYQSAVATIHKCSQDNHRFQDLAQQIVLTSTTREVTSLEDALFKPVQRLQRNTLVLYDLIKHTPQDHPDHDTLQNALHLSQRNLENFGTSLAPRQKAEQKGHLVKGTFFVELAGTSRKLRYVFLFSEMLVCTKRVQESRGGEVTFDCKWFIPMNELQLDTKFTYQDDMKFSKRDEIEDLKKKLRSVKNEIKKELKKDENKDKQRPVTSLVPSRTVEKLQRKANELEAQLILASPRLPFKVWHDAGKAHTFLLTTDYEREEWRELLSSLKRQSAKDTDTTVPLSAFGVQEMVNGVRGLPEINEIGSVLMETEEEAIYGTLNVTVHKLTGLSEPCDTYCCLEMDSYGHFFMKARTHITSNTTEPSWNADFELDLEGSQTLRVLCYKKGPDKQGDILLCRGALEMTKAWLKKSFQEKIVTMNEYSLVLSVCYTETEMTLHRTPVKQCGTAVFGVPIGTCATREGKTVPTIVTACVQEVERRGMKEMGIYRVSGVTSDVQRLKKHFDKKDVKVGVSSLGDMEIHTVTSLVKLYLRELPDPVFTEANYPNLLDALKLNDKEGKEKCMLSLFYNLPDINYYTAVYLLEHLLRITRYEAENKMSISNLSTIFGPTLLAPAPQKMALSVLELMTQGAEHCMKQSQVIHFYLTLLARGVSLRRSSAASDM